MTDASPATTDQSSAQTTSTPPLQNDPAARTADGTLKDAQTPPTTPTPDPKTDPKPTDDKTTTTPAVPDSYAFKAPEGQKLDDALVAAATPIFKELGLSQDAAQKLVDFYNTQAKTGIEAATKLVDTMRAGWKAETDKLPEITEKGTDAATALMGRAKATIFENDPKGQKAFDDAMNLTGAGDHPDIVRAWLRVAARITEGTHVSGKGPSDQGQSAPNTKARPSAAQAMYPNLPSATH